MTSSKCREDSVRLFIPEDISFVSFDPISFQEIVRPTICCIKQPSQFIGKNAAMLLLDRINISGPRKRQKVDLPDGIHVSDVRLPLQHELKPRHLRGLLEGVTALEGNAFRVAPRDWGTQLYREVLPQPLERLPVRLIPYYARCNRGQCEMSVWLPVRRWQSQII